MQWVYHTKFINTLAIIALLSLTFMGSLAWRQNKEQNVSNYWIIHTYQVMNAANNILIYELGLRVKNRAYLATGDTSYLQEFEKEIMELKHSFTALNVLTQDNSAQQKRMPLIDQNIEALITALNHVRQIYTNEGAALALIYLNSENFTATINTLRQQVNDILEEEKRLVNYRNMQSAQEVVRMNALIILGNLFGLLLILCSLLLLNYQIRMRQRTENELKILSHQLVDSNKKLLNSNKLLEEFAYSASHDLQEPLRMIHGYTDLFKRRYYSKIDTKADHYINFITQGALRMQRLIEDMLKYSRLDYEDRILKPIQLNDCLKWALANLAQLIEETGAKIEAQPLPQILGNFTQLGQLFQNILQNALHYQKNNIPPSVTIQLIDQENYWQIEISDNGIGIAPEHHERIFKLFQRLHLTEEKKAGTGIGLAICKRIVQNHNGEIWVISKTEAGSTFCIRLPKINEDDLHD